VLIDFASNAEIYSFEQPVTHLYEIVSGAVRTCKVLDDGRRYIGAFYLRGDIFGYEGGTRHTLSSEAICASTIRKIRLKSLAASASRGPDAGLDALTLAADEMRRAQIQSSFVVKTATERVATFLLHMSRHSAGQTPVQLPMSRQDIADYLGLTIETVSRVFTQFEESGLILRASLRHIVIRDRKALDCMNASA
jgi:CRP/FNR family nitrogen fixation transcriptional regulator